MFDAEKTEFGEAQVITFIIDALPAVHPLAFVTVTEYPVVEEGETMIEEAVAPVFHRYDVPPDAVSVAVSPIQMEVLPEIAGLGRDETITVTEAVLLPHASLTTTEYDVFADGETTIGFNVDPVLHE